MDVDGDSGQPATRRSAVPRRSVLLLLLLTPPPTTQSRPWDRWVRIETCDNIQPDGRRRNETSSPLPDRGICQPAGRCNTACRHTYADAHGQAARLSAATRCTSPRSLQGACSVPGKKWGGGGKPPKSFPPPLSSAWRTSASTFCRRRAELSMGHGTWDMSGKFEHADRRSSPSVLTYQNTRGPYRARAHPSGVAVQAGAHVLETR
ncbi:hypothetical protein LZ30DRAFT_20364 [Colletotrichum cereale]|nr:hypothetical protein LZ30DRAFT_20364 [Colletotrichum cereale]